MSSFERDHDHLGAAGVDEGAHGLVRPGRILDQQHQQPPVTDRDALEPAEGSRGSAEPCGDIRQRNAQRQAQCRRGERVVDVVEARAARARTRVVPSGGRQRERGAVEAPQLDLAGGDVEGGTGVPARRAAIVAEMARRTTRSSRTAPRSARSTSHRRRAGASPGDPRVVDAEHPYARAAGPQLGDMRVVGVQDELRVGQRGGRLAPAGREPRARRSGRAGRGRGSRAAGAFGWTRRATSGSAASSTSKSPARRRGPRGGWRRRRRRGSRLRCCGPPARVGRRISAAIAVVVVLPLVAETRPTRAESRPARSSIRLGSSFHASLPGQGRAPAAPEQPRERADTGQARRFRASVGDGGASEHGIRPRTRPPLANLPICSTIIGNGTKTVKTALPRGRADRSRGTRRLPGGPAQALHRRADPRGAARVGGPPGPLAHHEGVRCRSAGARSPADGDRALRLLERRQARGRVDAAPLRDEGRAARAAARGSARRWGGRRRRATSTSVAAPIPRSRSTGTRSARSRARSATRDSTSRSARSASSARLRRAPSSRSRSSGSRGSATGPRPAGPTRRCSPSGRSTGCSTHAVGRGGRSSSSFANGCSRTG